MNRPKSKIALVVSHPIQHFCPQYAHFAQHPGIQFKVFFGSALGYKKYLDPNFGKEISWDNLRLDAFDHHFLNGEQVLPADKYLDAPALDAALATFEPGLVIVYGYFQRMQRRAYRWAVRHRVPLAYISDSENRHAGTPWKDWLKGFFLRRYFTKVNWFLTVGDANEAFYRQHGVPQEKLLRMHFPIDVEQYAAAYERRRELNRQTRVKHGIDPDTIILSVVGKLTAWKNQDQLLEVLQMLGEKGKKITAFIIGSGPMQADWETRARSLEQAKIIFTGFVPIEELPAYYAATDIYVHPASMEPHSIAISEAIYMGCPVILSDRCGSYGEDDDVQPGRNGLVFPFGDTGELARQLERLVENKEERLSFGAQSHEIAVGYQQRAHYGVVDALLERLKNG